MTILLGTTQGLWEIESTPHHSWWHCHRFLLTGQAIAALAPLPSHGLLLATHTGALWYQAYPGQHWQQVGAPILAEQAKKKNGFFHKILARRLTPLAIPSDGVVRPRATVITVSTNGTIWCGSMPPELWSSTFATPQIASWHTISALHALPGADEWWGLEHATMPAITAISCDPRQPQHVTIAVAVGGIFHSPDSGTTWQEQQNGISPLFPPTAQYMQGHRDVVALIRHPNYPDHCYATTESAIYCTSTTQHSWQWEDITPRHLLGSVGLHGPLTPAVHERNRAFILAPCQEDGQSCTLWQTFDSGQSWYVYAEAPRFPTPAPGELLGTHILVSQQDDDSLIFITSYGDAYLHSGKQWKTIANHLGTITCAFWSDGC